MQEETVDGKITTAGHYKVLIRSSLFGVWNDDIQTIRASQFTPRTIRPRCEIEWDSTHVQWSFVIDRWPLRQNHRSSTESD